MRGSDRSKYEERKDAMVRMECAKAATGILRDALPEGLSNARCGLAGRIEAAEERMRLSAARMHARLACRSGQGTTEYAILVGVLVVIAIVAITMFRPKIEELWNAIADGINGL